MADDNHRGAGFDGASRSGSLRVLPCIDSTVRSGYFSAIREAMQGELLATAFPSTLGYRMESERPDAIVIATERFATAMWKRSGLLSEQVSAVPAVLLAEEVNASLRRRAARFHIRSVLPLEVSTDQLLAAIHATVAGLEVGLRENPSGEEGNAGWTAGDGWFSEDRLVEPLTARETDVLGLMARGQGNKEIGAHLAISEHTVKFHVSSILGKLGAASRTEAVTIGIMRGLVAV